MRDGMKEYKSCINLATANNCIYIINSCAYIIQHEINTATQKLSANELTNIDWKTIKDKACSIKEMVNVLIDVAKEETT